MKTKTKKIVAMIMLILTLCTSLPLNTFAAFITDINSNAQFGVIAGSKASYGHELHYAVYDGVQYLVFCANYGATSPNGGDYSYNGDFIVHYKNSAPQYAKVAEMIFFGYTMKHGVGVPTNDEAMRDACCTQQWVWEYIHNNIDGNSKVPARESWNGNYMSVGHLAEWTARTESYYNQYHGNTSFNNTTQKATFGETKMITDTSGKLASYGSFNQNIDGVIFNHIQGSNDLAVTVTEDCTADNVNFSSRNYGIYQLMPNGTPYSSDTMGNYIYIQFTSGAVQNLIFSNHVDPSAFNINIEIEYGNALVVKTNANGDSLAGCTFELYKDQNCTQKVRTGTSDSNGNVYFQRLAPAIYYVKETNVPNGYLLDNTVQRVDVKVNETAEIQFKNYEPTGELKLIKTDKETGKDNRADGTSHHGDATLNGTEYTLYAKEDIYNVARTVKYFSKDEEIATFNFNSNGVATIGLRTKSTTAQLTTEGEILKGLPMGSYYARETKVPEGYLQDAETHEINFNYKDMNTKVINLEDTFTNQVQKAKFEVIKMSSITNDTAPIVDGAEFTAILTKYVDYYGSFDEALRHLDEFSKDEYSIFKTENNGHGISGLLAYGKYTVNETYCPSDKVNPVKEFNVTIDKNSDGVIKELVENDTPFTSYIKMIKQDKKTGKTVTFSNATFELYKLNEETNEWEKVKCKLGKESFDKWTTDENGIAYTETKLVAGTYKVDEIKIPDGFLELEEECIFEVNRSNETTEYDEDMDAYITVNVQNEQPTGTLVIDKSIIKREDIDTSIVDISDLSGIKFKLTAKEDIIDYADGSVIYEKGVEVGTYNLDKDGNLTVENLPMGSYELEEIETLKGLALDKTKHEIVFKQEDTTTKVYTITKEIENKTTVFEFSKTDITGEKELEGATLTVLDENNEVVIDRWVSGEKTHKIEGLEVGKVYTLVEEITPDGFVKASNIRFKVEDTGEIQKVTMIDKVVTMKKSDIGGNEVEGAKLQVIDRDTEEVVDSWTSSKEEHVIKGLEEGRTYILHEEVAPEGYVIATDLEFTVTEDKETQRLDLIDKVVEVKKTDYATGEEIEGAELTVTDEDGNVIDKWISTKEPHKVTGLEEGKKYTLTEVTCPYGYEQAESIEFTVTTDKETQKIEMKDMPILKTIKVIKADSDTQQVIKSDFVFGIYEDAECTKLIKKVSSDKESGTVSFEDLRYGVYYLKELKQPNGYQLSDQVVKIEINDKGTFADGVLLEDNDSVCTFTFYNKQLPKIQTGSEISYVLLVSSIAISLLGIVTGIVVLKKKRK